MKNKKQTSQMQKKRKAKDQNEPTIISHRTQNSHENVTSPELSSMTKCAPFPWGKKTKERLANSNNKSTALSV